MKVLFTREISEEQIKLGKKSGLEISCIPLIRVTEYPAADIAFSPELLRDADTLIFTSIHAVNAVLRAFRNEHFNLNKKICCVGRKTALPFQDQEIEVIMPPVASAENISELILRDEHAKSLVYFHGNRSDKEFLEPAQLAGRKIQFVEVYRTEAVVKQVDTSGFDAIVFQSPSAVQAFYGIPENYPEAEVSIFASGLITAREIKKFTQQQVIVSDEPYIESIIHTLANALI